MNAGTDSAAQMVAPHPRPREFSFERRDPTRARAGSHDASIHRLDGLSGALLRATQMVADDLHGARRVVLAAIDVALRARQFEQVAWAIRAFDFVNGDIDLAVTLLMGTKPARAHLPAREAARGAFIRRIETKMPERGPGLIPYL